MKSRRVVACEWQGVPAYAKRLEPRHPVERVLLRLFAPLLRRWLVGPVGFEPTRRSPRAHFELLRLRELGEAGERVPRVLAHRAEAFVVEAVGMSLEHLLAHLPQRAQREHWVARAAQDLACFHRRGHWHGGAHVRNVGVSAQGLARFDFDRDLDRHFPVMVLQALDAIQFLTSLEGLHDAAAVAIAARVYFAVAPATALGVLGRTAGAVDRLARSRLLQRAAPKEAARLRALASALALRGAGPCAEPERARDGLRSRA